MTVDRRPTHAQAIGLALLVTVLWSSSWVLIRWGLDGQDLPPLTFAALRYGIAALVLCAWVAASRHRRQVRSIHGPMLGRIVALGVILYAVTQGAQFVAIDNQPATTTSLILSLTPLLVGVIAIGALREVPTVRQVTGAVLVAGGAWLYFAGDLGATAVGMTAALVGLAANVAASLLGRDVNRGEDVAPVVVTAISMAVGAIGLMAAALAVEGVPTVTAAAWLIIVWLAIVNTAFAFTLWNVSLRRLTAIESAGLNNTMLIQIGILAWLFLDEPLGVGEIVGVVLVTIGIFLTQALVAARRTTRAADADTR